MTCTSPAAVSATAAARRVPRGTTCTYEGAAAGMTAATVSTAAAHADATSDPAPPARAAEPPDACADVGKRRRSLASKTLKFASGNLARNLKVSVKQPKAFKLDARELSLMASN